MTWGAKQGMAGDDPRHLTKVTQPSGEGSLLRVQTRMGEKVSHMVFVVS